MFCGSCCFKAVQHFSPFHQVAPKSYQRLLTSYTMRKKKSKKTFGLHIAGHIISNPEKTEKGLQGEDAFFISNSSIEDSSFFYPNNNNDCTGTSQPLWSDQAFGVADGVGDWLFRRGVDSSQYSRQLMHHCKQIFEQQNGKATPKQILRNSFDRVQAMDGIEGSSTLCLARFSCKTGLLSIANLGDSGLFVVRDGVVVFQTEPQNHVFGVPYQLSSDHSDNQSSLDTFSSVTLKSNMKRSNKGPTVVQLKKQLRRKGLKISGKKQELIDRLAAAAHKDVCNDDEDRIPAAAPTFFNIPEDAQHDEFQLHHGDLVIAATDGFFDNLDHEEAAVDLWKMRFMDTPSLAKTIARHALDISRGAVRGVIDTPFSKQATEELNMIYSGGKLDDVTVVVAKVLKSNNRI